MTGAEIQVEMDSSGIENNGASTETDSATEVMETILNDVVKSLNGDENSVSGSASSVVENGSISCETAISVDDVDKASNSEAGNNTVSERPSAADASEPEERPNRGAEGEVEIKSECEDGPKTPLSTESAELPPSDAARPIDQESSDSTGFRK